LDRIGGQRRAMLINGCDIVKPYRLKKSDPIYCNAVEISGDTVKYRREIMMMAMQAATPMKTSQE
jgi:hypothetical protein